jgi:hypothetical protein
MSEVPQFSSAHEGTELVPGDELDFMKTNPNLESLAVIRAARDAHAAAVSREAVRDGHEILPVPLPTISEIGDNLDAVRQQWREAA